MTKSSYKEWDQSANPSLCLEIHFSNMVLDQGNYIFLKKCYNLLWLYSPIVNNSTFFIDLRLGFIYMYIVIISYVVNSAEDIICLVESKALQLQCKLINSGVCFFFGGG